MVGWITGSFFRSSVRSKVGSGGGGCGFQYNLTYKSIEPRGGKIDHSDKVPFLLFLLLFLSKSGVYIFQYTVQRIVLFLNLTHR